MTFLAAFKVKEYSQRIFSNGIECLIRSKQNINGPFRINRQANIFRALCLFASGSELRERDIAKEKPEINLKSKQVSDRKSLCIFSAKRIESGIVDNSSLQDKQEVHLFQ